MRKRIGEMFSSCPYGVYMCLVTESPYLVIFWGLQGQEQRSCSVFMAVLRALSLSAEPSTPQGFSGPAAASPCSVLNTAITIPCGFAFLLEFVFPRSSCSSRLQQGAVLCLCCQPTVGFLASQELLPMISFPLAWSSWPRVGQKNHQGLSSNWNKPEGMWVLQCDVGSALSGKEPLCLGLKTWKNIPKWEKCWGFWSCWFPRSSRPQEVGSVCLMF